MGEDAEKKYLASLDFDIAKGNKSLEELTKELNTLANNSEKLFEKMSKNMKGAFNIDTSGLSKTSKTNIERAIAQAEKYKAKAEAFEKEITKIKEQEAEKRATISHRENEKIRKYHETTEQQMTEDTKKGVADRIAEYAKTYLIYQGFNQLKQAVGDVIQEMVSVESQMVSIERVMEEGSIVVDEYRDKLIKLAYDYGNSFDNVADITLRLAQAGFDANEALALTEKTLLALNTADLDATEATSDMVAVMAQWGLMTGDATQEAEDYASIIDKINKVADNFPTTSADIMDALKKVSSAFNLAGASIDETIATIVAAEKASQRGGKAIGTALSNISQQLKDSKKIDIAKDLGISFFTDETEQEYKSLLEILNELSAKMQQLKSEGKESSAEMQKLLSVFTVFRRNVGASLLGEMAGETSTYAKVLETSMNSVGYSVKENEKYMRTAEAAQKQFNATLLELKTSVWDNGLEKVFRSMLLMGGDVANSIKSLTDIFGVLPVTIAACTAALSVFNKSVDIRNIKNGINNLSSFKNAIKDAFDVKYNKARIDELTVIMRQYNTTVGKGTKTLEEFSNEMGDKLPKDFNNYAKGLKGTKASYEGYVAQTKLARIETIALNTAISLGLSFALQAVIELINSYTHALENATEVVSNMNSSIKDVSKEVGDYISKYSDIKKAMEDTNLTQEEQNVKKRELIKLQKEIIEKYGDEAKAIDLVNGSLEVQEQKLLAIQKAQYANEAKKNFAEINKVVDEVNAKISKSVALTSANPFENSQKAVSDIANIITKMGGTIDVFGKDVADEIDNDFLSGIAKGMENLYRCSFKKFICIFQWHSRRINI